jgi:hypothetical protein
MALGHIDYESRTIRIAKQAHNKAVGKHERSDTFWHELTHAILHDMKHPLSADEVFVEKFSKRLNDAVHSAKF